MRPRDNYLEYQKTLDNSGTLTINLNMNDPISELLLKFTATNGATGNQDNPILRNITKVEVVDGSDVLTSADAPSLAGADAFLRGRIPSQWVSTVPGDGPLETLPLLFGRHLYDPDYALDPGKFANPQLKLTWDMAHVNTIGDSGYVTDTLKLTVLARLMEEAPAPKGLLTVKDIYDFTSVGSGDERVDLPVDWPYRALFVRVYDKGTDFLSNITRIKLSADADKYIPFDLYTGEIVANILDNYPPLVSKMDIRSDELSYRETWMGQSQGGSGLPSTTEMFVSASQFWQGRVRLIIHDRNGAAKQGNVFVTDNGCCYYNVIPIPFGLLGDPASWFDARRYGSLRLYLSQGDADAACSVVLQQLRTY